jgi:hypothetical protein
MSRASDLANVIASGSTDIVAEGTATTNLQEGLVKAWGDHNNSGSTINKSFNVSSLTDVATGQSDFILTNPLKYTIGFSGYSVQHIRTSAAATEASSVRNNGNNSSTLAVVTNAGNSDVDRNRAMTIHGDLA